MTISMYRASVPVFIRMLNNLAAILEKAAAHAAARKIDPVVLLNTRLYSDMFALTRQVQIAADGAKGCAAQLAGVEPSSAEAPDFAVFNRGDDYGFEHDATSFPELIARIQKTVAYLNTLKQEQIDGSEQRTITLTMRSDKRVFAGLPFLLNYVLPNFFFHVTAAYAILRHCGVEIGKQDYQGKF